MSCLSRLTKCYLDFFLLFLSLSAFWKDFICCFIPFLTFSVLFINLVRFEDYIFDNSRTTCILSVPHGNSDIFSFYNTICTTFSLLSYGKSRTAFIRVFCSGLLTFSGLTTGFVQAMHASISLFKFILKMLDMQCTPQIFYKPYDQNLQCRDAQLRCTWSCKKKP